MITLPTPPWQEGDDFIVEETGVSLQMLKTNRIVRNLSHAPTEVGNQDVFAAVKCFVFVGGLSNPDSSPIFSATPRPVNAFWRCLVKVVLSNSYAPKVCYSIIGGVMVDVINYMRLFAVNEKPSNPVGVETLALKTDRNVAVSRWRSSKISHLDSVRRSSYPSKQARIGIVVKEIADRFWNNLCSHIAPPCGLVRGLVTAITSTPILSWRAAL